MKGVRTAFNGASRIGLLAMVYVLGVLTLSLCIAGRASACPWVEATKEAIVAKVQGSGGLPNNPHQGASERVLAEIVSIYTTAADRLNAEVAEAARKLAADPESGSARFALQRSASLLDNVNRLARDAGRRGRSLVGSAVKDSVAKGITQAGAQLRELGLDQAAKAVGQEASFATIDARAVELIAGDTVARLDRSLKLHADNAVKVFKDLSRGGALGGRDAEVNRIIAQGIISGDPRDTERAVRELFRGDSASEQAESFRKLGNRMIEVGGWTGTVRSYSAMVAITRTREATVTARHQRLTSQGFGLVQVTGANSKNFCTRYVGMVFALNEAASDGGKYPLLSSLPRKGPPFHPRCSKGTALYVPELVSDERAQAYEAANRRFEASREAGTLLEPVAA